MRQALSDRFTYGTDEGRKKWHQQQPSRRLDCSLGRPILVADDDGNYLPPLPQPTTPELSEEDQVFYAALQRRAQQVVGTTTATTAATTHINQIDDNKDDAAIMHLLASGWTTQLESRSEDGKETMSTTTTTTTTTTVAGTGVFCLTTHQPNDYLGPYMGTVWDEETWEELLSHAEKDNDKVKNNDIEIETKDANEILSEDYVFSLHYGAHAVIIDGAVGVSINPLKHLNHGCDPNVIMKEMYIGGCWHVLIFALKEISVMDELLHDYQLTTEDIDDERLKIACTCGSAKCRGQLFAYEEW
jgi:hypothetical protein